MAEEQQVIVMLKAGNPDISIGEIYGALAEPANRMQPLTSDKDGKPDNRFKIESRNCKRNPVTDVKEPVRGCPYILE